VTDRRPAEIGHQPKPLSIRIAEFHRGLALLLSLVRYPEALEARP